MTKTVVIQSQKYNAVLFQGTMFEGRLKDKVDPKLALHSGWKSRVLIGILDENMPSSDSTNLFIQGLVIQDMEI